MTYIPASLHYKIMMAKIIRLQLYGGENSATFTIDSGDNENPEFKAYLRIVPGY